jgi:CelD/BcsL family acetyltransferase involved in cellulose biosynthesis
MSGRIEVTRVVRPADLTDEELSAWRAIQAVSPELERPFFAPEWFRALEEAGHEVEIAVLSSEGAHRAFFPFHRSGSAALPPGGRLSDFHGWIGASDLPIDVEVLLDAIGVRMWRFTHLLACQRAAASHSLDHASSPTVDLSEGFEAFVAHHRARGAKWVPHVPRKMRKIGREIGALRFELSSTDAAVFPQLLAWKGEQRRRTGSVDPLVEPWAERTVTRCLASAAPALTGVLSALYAGDHLIAAHLGLRSGSTLHLWFPAYDIAYERYSPGSILHYELFRAAAETGIVRVDFGKGPEPYKASWMTGEEVVVDGYVDLRPIGRLVNAVGHTGRRWVRGTAIAALIRVPKRRLAGLRRRLRTDA